MDKKITNKKKCKIIKKKQLIIFKINLIKIIKNFGSKLLKRWFNNEIFCKSIKD